MLPSPEGMVDRVNLTPTAGDDPAGASALQLGAGAMLRSSADPLIQARPSLPPGTRGSRMVWSCVGDAPCSPGGARSKAASTARASGPGAGAERCFPGRGRCSAGAACARRPASCGVRRAPGAARARPRSRKQPKRALQALALTASFSMHQGSADQRQHSPARRGITVQVTRDQGPRASRRRSLSRHRFNNSNRPSWTRP